VYAIYSLFASCIYVDLMPAGRFPTISWKIELHAWPNKMRAFATHAAGNELDR
jgi:hypothetical protein